VCVEREHSLDESGEEKTLFGGPKKSGKKRDKISLLIRE
jgi:hypothetical protein